MLVLILGHPSFFFDLLFFQKPGSFLRFPPDKTSFLLQSRRKLFGVEPKPKRPKPKENGLSKNKGNPKEKPSRSQLKGNRPTCVTPYPSLSPPQKESRRKKLSWPMKKKGFFLPGENPGLKKGGSMGLLKKRRPVILSIIFREQKITKTIHAGLVTGVDDRRRTIFNDNGRTFQFIAS